MRVLVVEYLPRGELSRTRRLLEAALSALPPDAEITRVDLARKPPRALDVVSLNAYIARNYAGLALSDDQSASLAEADALTGQLLACDALILACPVFNYSVPAAVKAWLDAVIQKNRTWRVAAGRRTGLVSGRPALVLMTSGGELSGARDHARPLVEICLASIGITQVRLILVDRLNSDPAHADDRLAAAAGAARDDAERLSLAFTSPNPSTPTEIPA